MMDGQKEEDDGNLRVSLVHCTSSGALAVHSTRHLKECKRNGDANPTNIFSNMYSLHLK